ncbi:MAG TPA: alkaline phosphatase [Terriglobales bacterium]|nr:alkaline phosphatase [Terriglobales bacterium]
MLKSSSLVILAFLALLVPGASARNAQTPTKIETAKYVIIMVPDGTGLADITAGRIKKNGVDGAPLAIETLDRIGYARTYSANNTVTDSAAAASAMGCGEKFINGEICFHADGRPHNPSLLELAKAKGMGTGLVATSTITHATPASFGGAHVKSRSCEQEIARQFIESARPDVILGGGFAKFNSQTPDKCGTQGDFVTKAETTGYTLLTNTIDLQRAVAKNPARVLGLFSREGMTPEYLRKPDTAEPRLPEMAKAALQLLERNPNGFFVMIEGSQVDWGNHDNNLDYQTGELLAFDEAVKVVLDWINAVPERKAQTLLVISPDHETGGFSIMGDENTPGLGSFKAGWTTKGHTGTDVVVWSQGPGSERLGRSIQNTEIYKVASKSLK